MNFRSVNWKHCLHLRYFVSSVRIDITLNFSHNQFVYHTTYTLYWVCLSLLFCFKHQHWFVTLFIFPKHINSFHPDLDWINSFSSAFAGRKATIVRWGKLLPETTQLWMVFRTNFIQDACVTYFKGLDHFSVSKLSQIVWHNPIFGPLSRSSRICLKCPGILITRNCHMCHGVDTKCTKLHRFALLLLFIPMEYHRTPFVLLYTIQPLAIHLQLEMHIFHYSHL